MFAALSPPIEVGLALNQHLAPLEIPGKQVPSENRHITLRFVGDLDQVGLERWMAALDSVPLGNSFRIGLDGLGAFPRPAKATVLWIGIGVGREPLELLANVVENAAVDAGLGYEERPFRGHLTLSRIRPQQDVRALTRIALPELVWKAEEVVLFRSHLGSGPAHYERLESFPLDN